MEGANTSDEKNKDMSGVSRGDTCAIASKLYSRV